MNLIAENPDLTPRVVSDVGGADSFDGIPGFDDIAGIDIVSGADLLGFAVEPEALMRELLDEIADSQQIISRQSRVLNLLVTRFSKIYLYEAGGPGVDGNAYRAMVAELAFKLKLGERHVETLAQHAEVMTHQLPDIGLAIDGNHITIEQARVITRVGEGIPIEDRDQYVQTMLSLACGSEWFLGIGPFSRTIDENGDRLGLSTTALRRAANKLKNELDPEKLAEQHDLEHESRHISVEPAENGMAWLKLYMSASDAFGIYHGVNQAAKQLRPAINANPQLFGYTGETRPNDQGGFYDFQNRKDLPTLSQLRLDIALDLLLSGGHSSKKAVRKVHKRYQTGRNHRQKFSSIRLNPTIHLTVPVLSLLGVDAIPADLSGYGPISAELAKLLCAQAKSFTRILTHPETGAVLSVGRNSYRVPKSLRNELIVRDQHCRFPGCGMSANRSDIDHTDAWRHEGETAKENLAHLCRRHHLLKHMGENNPQGAQRPRMRWRVTQTEQGMLHWQTPLGQKFTTRPEQIPSNKVTFAKGISPLRT